MPASGTLRYLSPDCGLTLRAGIAELREAEGADHDAAAQVAPELWRDLDIHDAIHVLFGCPTTLRGEIAAHVWTVWGTNLPMRDMHRVTGHADHRQVLRSIGHARLVQAWFRGLGAVITTIVRSLRMTRRFDVASLEAALDRPLKELRSELGIILPPPTETTRDKSSRGAALRHVHRSTRSIPARI